MLSLNVAAMARAPWPRLPLVESSLRESLSLIIASKLSRQTWEGVLFLRNVMASNVLSGSNHEGASANTFAVATVIVTPLELTLVNAVTDDDGNDDGNSAGAEHHGIIPRATSIDCTIARLVGARLDLRQAILLYIPCLTNVEPEHSNATGTGML